jgi:hypothetical protein
VGAGGPTCVLPVAHFAAQRRQRPVVDSGGRRSVFFGSGLRVDLWPRAAGNRNRPGFLDAQQ